MLAFFVERMRERRLRAAVRRRWKMPRNNERDADALPLRTPPAAMRPS
jgi:hypothetical protein